MDSGVGWRIFDAGWCLFRGKGERRKRDECYIGSADRNANSGRAAIEGESKGSTHGYKGFNGANYTCDDQHAVITA